MGFQPMMAQGHDNAYASADGAAEDTGKMPVPRGGTGAGRMGSLRDKLNACYFPARAEQRRRF